MPRERLGESGTIPSVVGRGILKKSGVACAGQRRHLWSAGAVIPLWKAQAAIEHSKAPVSRIADYLGPGQASSASRRELVGQY
jgi:hypothetical protein